MTNNSDALIGRLSRELEERSQFIQGLMAGAQDGERDLNDAEKALVVEARSRIGEIKVQLELAESTAEIASDVANRARALDQAIVAGRRTHTAAVEYRSAGAYLLDSYAASMGDVQAKQRIEVYERAAQHQKTSDNAGLIPTPILGPVVNFIDAARPIVNQLGTRDMPSATWYRPKVTQHTSVAKQGSAGAAADEKSELVSQKMTITNLTANAVTYGGYVNVSRQNIDFSSPAALDAVVNDLAAQYAIQTEAATGAALLAATQTQEISGTGSAAFTSDNLTAALWAAAGTIYSTMKGAGSLVLAVAPDQLGNWGKLFAPVNPQNAQSSGFQASNFGQGVMGAISGIPVVVSAGLTAGTIGVLFSTAAVECYEQKVGQLQAVEPSVLGVQVAYAGYFTPVTVEANGIVKLLNAS